MCPAKTYITMKKRNRGQWGTIGKSVPQKTAHIHADLSIIGVSPFFFYLLMFEYQNF